MQTTFYKSVRSKWGGIPQEVRVQGCISGVATRGAWSLESLLLFKCTSNSEQYQWRDTPPSRMSLLLPLAVPWEVEEEDDSVTQSPRNLRHIFPPKEAGGARCSGIMGVKRVARERVRGECP